MGDRKLQRRPPAHRVAEQRHPRQAQEIEQCCQVGDRRRHMVVVHAAGVFRLPVAHEIDGNAGYVGSEFRSDVVPGRRVAGEAVQQQQGGPLS
jgi:hypothetical protein